MAKTRKYYVVWQGQHPGVYNNWDDCKEQVEGYSDAKYKAFESREAAEEAYANGYEQYIQKNPTPRMVFEKMMKEKTPVIGRPINNSLAVDAACSGNPGDMEYRGVYTATGQEIFRVGPMPKGTNNVGEFLALVPGKHLANLPHSNTCPNGSSVS